MKKKVRIIAAAVLAVVLLAGLWYAWPRSWDSVAGTEEVSSMYGLVSLFSTDDRGVHIDCWTMSAEQAEGQAAETIMGTLRGGSYRAKLWNLIPGERKFLGAGSVYIGINLGSRWVAVSVHDDGLVFFTCPESGRYAVYQADKELYTKLINLVQENGTLRK